MAAPPTNREPQDPSGEAWRAHARWFTILGILWIVLGLAAIFLPLVASLAIGILFGTLLLIGGVAQVLQAFRVRGWAGFGAHLAGGLLALAVGFLMVFDPFGGVITLTLLLAGLFIVDGILTIIAGVARREPAVGWLIASGGLEIVIGVIIWLDWPGSAAWALGVLVGVQLILFGITLVIFANALRNASSAATSTI